MAKCRCSQPLNRSEGLVHLAGAQLKCLLKVVDLENNGRPVSVDGLRPRAPAEKPFKRKKIGSSDHSISAKANYCDIKAISRFEPRIRFIQKQLRSILRIADFTFAAKPVEVNGFRLKNLGHWVSDPLADDNHGDPYHDILQYLSWPCETNCAFCLFKGDPPGYFSKSKYSWMTPLAEIKTRLKYWDCQNNKALFAKSDYNFYEILNHSHFFEIASEARQKTDRCFNIVTSGTYLTDRLVEKLQHIMPVFVIVSLNSDEIAIRRTVMKDSNPTIAIGALARLKDRKIPYAVSITAYEGIPPGSIIQTIVRADRFDPYFIRVVLDAHTRYHRPSARLDTSIERWKEITRIVRDTRQKISSPIFIQPVMFEECYFDSICNHVKVEGVVKNSPAWKAGLKYGDEIDKINDIAAISRPFARYLLHLCARENMKEIEVTVKRSNKTFKTKLRETKNNTYPYQPYQPSTPVFYPYGILLLHGLDPAVVLEIGPIIKKYQARKVLFLSSHLMKRSLQDFLNRLDVFRGVKADFFIEIPENKSFLGGDIIVGDLLVNEDFIACIEDFIRTQGTRPDLVIIPSTPFTKWKRDLKGNFYKQIERTLGIPVVLLECTRIFNIN